MTENVARDPELSRHLAAIGTPEHDEGFWSTLDTALEDEPTPMAPGPPRPSPGDDPAPSVVVDLEHRLGEDRVARSGGRHRRLLLAAAAAVIAVVAGVAVLRGADADRDTDIVTPSTTSTTTTTPSTTTTLPSDTVAPIEGTRTVDGLAVGLDATHVHHLMEPDAECGQVQITNLSDLQAPPAGTVESASAVVVLDQTRGAFLDCSGTLVFLDGGATMPLDTGLVFVSLFATSDGVVGQLIADQGNRVMAVTPELELTQVSDGARLVDVVDRPDGTRHLLHEDFWQTVGAETEGDVAALPGRGLALWSDGEHALVQLEDGIALHARGEQAEATMLVPGVADAESAAVSPDGRHVVWAEDGHLSLLLDALVDDGAPAVIATDVVGPLRFTPDSTRLVYSSIDDDGFRTSIVPLTVGSPPAEPIPAGSPEEAIAAFVTPEATYLGRCGPTLERSEALFCSEISESFDAEAEGYPDGATAHVLIDTRTTAGATDFGSVVVLTQGPDGYEVIDWYDLGAVEDGN